MTQGGSVTQEGKEVVKWNAARHGVLENLRPEGDPEDLLEEISIPGVPDNTQEWEDYDVWNAGAVEQAWMPSPQPPTRIRRNCCR
jgi:hypothetical protein